MSDQPSDDFDWFAEMRFQVLRAIESGLETPEIHRLMSRAKCAEHAAIMFRLSADFFEIEDLAGEQARRSRAISKALRQAVYERDGEQCAYCGTEKGPFHLDHILPVVRGGKATLDNLTVACGSCNSSKGALTPDEWRVRRG